MTENEMQIEKADYPNHKSPYTHPQLTVYGDIWEITLAKREGKDKDNAGPQQEFNMTGFSGPSPTPTRDPQG